MTIEEAIEQAEAVLSEPAPTNGNDRFWYFQEQRVMANVLESLRAAKAKGWDYERFLKENERLEASDTAEDEKANNS